jgi:L-aspartate oxidase
MQMECDYLVIGSGLAGLTYALKVADHGPVLLVTKASIEQSNSRMAQGGIAAVLNHGDSFDKHIEDTLVAGAGLCHQDVVKEAVLQGPERIRELENWGVKFDQGFTREGGHTESRILHVQDITGNAIQQTLIERVREHKNITVLEHHFAIDLLTSRKLNPFSVEPNRCYGAYVFHAEQRTVTSIMAKWTVLATGGAGKVYLYTSNWSGATGDGIAMAYRAGARVANMEFMQFHPTCLYHPKARNFLVSEAVRGEGGELINDKGVAFMKKHHPLGSLAPRDIVARSIDAEMKRTGAESVFIDITHKNREFLQQRFPMIFQKCLDYGIDISQQPIPVVPAAHYLCGGVLANAYGQTDIQNLLAVGETACNGFHGANRLASNSLLDCTVFSHNAGTYCIQHPELGATTDIQPQPWQFHDNQDNDELIVISHMWDEIRQLMWDYVGIVRSNRRLLRAQHRLKNMMQEIREYYWNFKLHPDILELRNLAAVASLTVRCALKRKESVGIHFNLDKPASMEQSGSDTVI